MGYSLRGCKELDTTKQLTHTHTHTHTQSKYQEFYKCICKSNIFLKFLNNTTEDSLWQNTGILPPESLLAFLP